MGFFDESSDDDEQPAKLAAPQRTTTFDGDEEAEDPLDAYMKSLQQST
jgi:hypothetical protein